MKNQYLTHNLIKSYVVQYKVLKDGKEVGGLTKLIGLLDGLSWMDSFQKYLWNIPGDKCPYVRSVSTTKLQGSYGVTWHIKIEDHA